MSEKAFLWWDAENKRLKEKKKKIEEQNLQETNQIIEKKRRKKIETEERLSKLKEAIQEGKVDNSALKFASEISQDGVIDSEEISEILTKIDQINDNPKITRYLPEELRITKEEYLAALKNPEKKKLLLEKTDDALGHLALQVWSNGKLGLNIFASLILLLDRNLVLIQENHIDIKRNLEGEV